MVSVKSKGKGKATSLPKSKRKTSGSLVEEAPTKKLASAMQAAGRVTVHTKLQSFLMLVAILVSETSCALNHRVTSFADLWQVGEVFA